jgi:hypothetical protein
MKRLIIEEKPGEETPSARLVKTYFSMEEHERSAYRDAHNIKAMQPDAIHDLSVLVADGDGLVESMEEEAPQTKRSHYAANNHNGTTDGDSLISIKSTTMKALAANEKPKRNPFEWTAEVEEDADHFSDYGGYYGGYGGVYYADF